MTAEELLAEWRRWILANAYEALRAASPSGAADPDRVQDIAQEGNIALWREYQRLAGRPDDERGRLAGYAAKRRMVSVAIGGRRGRLTGHVPSQGTQSVEATAIFDAHADEDGRTTLGETLTPAFEDAYDEILLAYHYGDIHKALDDLRLDFRDYIELRFWEGLSDGEISAKTGVPRTTLNNRWKRTIEPGLRKALDHLRGAA